MFHVPSHKQAAPCQYLLPANPVRPLEQMGDDNLIALSHSDWLSRGVVLKAEAEIAFRGL